MLSTHQLVNITMGSENPMNRETGYKEGINGRKIRKREIEWTYQKERGGSHDSLDCFLLAIIL